MHRNAQRLQVFGRPDANQDPPCERIGDATVVEESLQRWKYATPTTVLEVPLVAAMVAPPIVCCGDAFAGPKVEGAASSGMAAGRWVGRMLGDA